MWFESCVKFLYKINPTIAASQIGAYFPHCSWSSIFRIGATTWRSQKRPQLLLVILVCQLYMWLVNTVSRWSSSEIVSSFRGEIKEGGGNGKWLIVPAIWDSLFFTRKTIAFPEDPYSRPTFISLARKGQMATLAAGSQREISFYLDIFLRMTWKKRE